MDGTYMSKSFSGGQSTFLNRMPSERNQRKTRSGISKITYKGYLLKRSNRPFRDQSHDEYTRNPDEFPELPMMSGMFSTQAENDVVGDSLTLTAETLTTSPLHSRLVVQSIKSSQRNSDNNTLQQGLDAAASFFGISLRAQPEQRMNSHQSSHVYKQEVHESPPLRRPTPAIPMLTIPGSHGIHSTQSSFHESLHRRHELPVLDHSDSALSDFVDQQDGHLWRAKYCVLEDGILYFYRNRTDGESVDAVRERSEDSSLQQSSHGTNQGVGAATVFTELSKSPRSRDITDLSKSPMTRSMFRNGDWTEDRDSVSCMWEKRVVLDCVGAVRSAEIEYGPNSFELQGIVNDADPKTQADTLVLRARDHASMKEWIFQFHRSLASFVRDMMDVFGTRAYLDIDFSVDYPTNSTHNTAGDEERLRRLLSRSPRISNSPPVPNALSHGHGRITVHRRRHRVSGGKSSNGVETPCSPTIERNGDVGSGNDEFPASRPVNLGVSGIDRGENEFLFPAGTTGAKEPERQRPLDTRMADKALTVHQKYVPPSLRRKQELEPSFNVVPNEMCAPTIGCYVPLGLRNRPERSQEGLRTLEQRERLAKEVIGPVPLDISFLPSSDTLDILDDDTSSTTPFHLGGCADPRLVAASIMDAANIPRKASIVTRNRSEPFGSSKFGREVGAISERGIRDANEDAYLIANDLIEALTSPGVVADDMFALGSGGVSLFAIFDGHCGNQAARYAAEKLTLFLEEQLRLKKKLDTGNISSTLHDALINLDDAFCRICHEDGREWESGTTALVAVLMENSLTIANLGDCRGIVCRVVDRKITMGMDWNVLDAEHIATPSDGPGEGKSCVWKEVASVHKPSDEHEQTRIESANGWITTETEIPIGQLRRMDFLDEDVVGILRRCFSDRYEDSGGIVRECRSAPQRILNISRVCGELAVSRAIGDRDFKAAFHQPTKNSLASYHPEKTAEWDCPLFLSYPDDHNHVFNGNLIDNSPDIVQIEIGDTESLGEFLLFASDGLWDVLDADDAVRVTHDLLFRKNFTAKRAAVRLAELAVHLGSSDNITVIVIRITKTVQETADAMVE